MINVVTVIMQESPCQVFEATTAVFACYNSRWDASLVAQDAAKNQKV